jgi:hypothetical protein
VGRTCEPTVRHGLICDPKIFGEDQIYINLRLCAGEGLVSRMGLKLGPESVKKVVLYVGQKSKVAIGR